MNQQVIKYVAILSLLFAASFVAAEESTSRSYQLPGHGFIRLQVPPSWKDELRQPPDGLPPTIVFSPKAGSSFKILLTPLFSVRQGMAMPAPSEIKKDIEQAAENVKSQAVEKTIPVNDLKGSAVTGYYFSATDSSPKPGEYKYLTQGMFRVGELAPTFTILTNDGANNVIAESLSMLKNALHVNQTP